MTNARTRTALAILGAGAVAATVLHVVAGTTFPSPWPDEIDFLVPAAQLARHFTFATPQLSAPHGMFWEPELMYFVWAPVLRFAPLVVTSARWVSLGFVVAAAVGFFVAGRRAGVAPIAAATACALWLVTPEVIAAGNIARPEAMVLAFVAWAAAATLYERPVLALSFAALACVSHSAGVPFAVVIAAANVARHRTWRRPQRAEWLFAGVVVVFYAWQAFHLLAHHTVALDQLHFQASVHSHVTHGNRLPYIEVTAVIALATALLRKRIGWGGVMLGALAVVGIAVLFIGWEMWYEVYAVDTAPLLVAFVALLALRGAVPTPAIARATAALVVVGFAVVCIPPTVHPGFEGMALGRHPQEWKTFERRVRTELARIDASVTQPSTVVLNDVSGLPWPLQTDRFGAHLRFVKETLVTTKPLVPTQFALWTLGHRPPPHGRVIARVSSPHRRFTAVFVDLR